MSLAHEFTTFIHAHRNVTDGKHLDANYSGSNHLHYGISVPDLSAFVKAWAKDHATLTLESYIDTLQTLCFAPSMDEKRVVGMLLVAYPKLRRQIPLHHLPEWIGQLVGWEEIDSFCQSTFGAKDLLNDWQAWHDLLHQLATSTLISHRRASLVLLNLPIRESNDPRLRDTMFEVVDLLQKDTDKLITKAISWLLRTAIKHHADAVNTYVTTHESTLGKTTVREVRTKLTTGKKSS